MFWLYFLLGLVAIGLLLMIFFAGSKTSMRRQPEEITEEVAKYNPMYQPFEKMEGIAQPAMERPESVERSMLYRMIAKLGYQKARLDDAQKQADERLRFSKKLRKTKIALDIVKFLGVKTSAKLAINGYRLKRKVDEVKRNIQSRKAAAA